MKLFFCLIFFCSCRLFPQINPDSAQGIKSNLDIFYILADSSAGKAESFIPGNSKQIILQLNLGNDYSILGNQIISFLQKNQSIVLSGNDEMNRNSREELTGVSFVIDNANVKYGEMFRDGFLGDYYIQRNILLSGNFTINTPSVKYIPFSFISADTVRADELRNLENSSFPFTQGKIPAEPFFSGLLEPAIAIGTAAVAVFLFFTIRSR